MDQDYGHKQLLEIFFMFIADLEIFLELLFKNG